MKMQPADIQGNIIRPFGRPHAKYLFMQFTAEPPVVRERLHKLLNQTVTSADLQAKLAAEWKESLKTKSSQTAGMFGVSHAGLLKLQRTGRAPLSPPLGLEYFQAGMRQQQLPLWEPEVNRWQSEYRQERMDAFLLLCDNDQSRLDKTTKAAKDQLAGFAKVMVEEEGSAIKIGDNTDDTYEPFGFRDGLSTIPDPESVFTPEPGAAGGFGCYAVFGKFAQHVEKFRQTAKAIEAAARAEGLALTAEQAGALAIGRQRDGTPLAPLGSDGINDFTFKGVPASTCPFHAHIRATNSRDGFQAFELIRRGMPYPARDGCDPGLLFLSFQRSLMDFIGMFYRAHLKFDPILTQSSQPGPFPSGGQPWPTDGEAINYPMRDLTTLLGGEYFYIPSMIFLSNLAQGNAAAI